MFILNSPFKIDPCKTIFLCMVLQRSRTLFLLHVAIQLLKRLFFPLLKVLAPCECSNDHKSKGLFLSSQFYSTTLCVCAYASTTQP